MGKAIIVDLDFSKFNIGKVTKDEGYIDSSGNIIFKDKAVKAICVNSYGNGSEVSLEEAQSVNTISLNTFSNNTVIETFDELKLFENVTKLEGSFNNGAFFGCTNLRSISLPKSITTIGSDAFMNCVNMQIAVDLPNLQSVRFGAFHNSGIKEIANLGKVKDIPNRGSSSSHTFAGMCPNLAKVVLPITLTSIGSYAFAYDTSLKTLVCEALIPPTLDPTAFSNTELNTIQVPIESVNAYKTADVWKNYADIIVAIGDSTEDTPIVPDEPTTYILTANATNGSLIAKLNGNPLNLPYMATEGDVVVIEVTPNDGYKFSSWADGSIENPRTITITSDITLTANCVESTVRYIDFADEEVLRVLLANGVGDGVGVTESDAAEVKSIEKWFKGNTAITSFNEFKYFTGVTSLPGGWQNGAFYDCKNLRAITFPSSLTDIGIDCFMGCSALSIEVSLTNLNNISYGAFQSTAITKILDLGKITTIPNAGSSSSHKTFGNCSQLEVAKLPSTLESIGNKAFSGCSILKTVVIYATTPPTLGIDVFGGTHADLLIYIPDGAVDAYKTDWADYADKIKPLSEYIE
jgi:hypothetical protein